MQTEIDRRADLHPADARVYDYHNYQSVLPLPEWPDLPQWKKARRHIRQHLMLCAGLNAQTAAFKAKGRVVRRFEHEGLIVENLCIETRQLDVAEEWVRHQLAQRRADSVRESQGGP